MESHRNSYSFHDENAIFEVSVLSSIGDREDQQDASGLYLKNKEGIIVIADGMGGTAAGKMAADSAVHTIIDAYSAQDYIADIPAFLLNAAKDADKKIFNFQDVNAQKIDAGSTVVASMIRENNLFWISVGDSRLYIIREGTILQLTQDHNYASVLQDGLRCGAITQEDVEQEREKGEALVSYLGLGELLLTDQNTDRLPLKKDDILIMMTDGLYKILTDKEIENVLGNFRNIEDAASVLEQKAKKTALKGQQNRDNTTFVIIKVK